MAAPRLLTALLASVALTLSCANTEPVATTTAPTAPSAPVPTTSTSTPATTTTTETPTTTTTGLAGAPIDIGPMNGDVLAVIGVAHDDVLNVRAGPDTDRAVVATLGPLADDVVAEGRARLLPNSIWFEVTVDGVVGWASDSFLAYLGRSDDATAEVLAAAPGVLVADTPEQLGLLAAQVLTAEDAPSDLVMVAAPVPGELAEVTFDAIGLRDDAVRGYRLRVVAENPGFDDVAFVVKSAERTLLCDRGVSAGLCV